MPRCTTPQGIELEWAEEGEGPPLLLIMGLATQMIHWHPEFLAVLRSRGFRIIRFDNRDTGKSTLMTEAGVPQKGNLVLRWLSGLPVPSAYTLADMAEDTVGLLDALDLPAAHVLGISMGGMVAQILAIRYPERVLSLTSMLSTPGDRAYVFGKVRAIREVLRPPPRSREEAGPHLVRRFSIIGSPGFPMEKERLHDTGQEAWDRCPDPRGNIRQFAAILASGSRRQALGRLNVPALVIHGKDDPLVPVAAGRATAAAIPGARYLEIPGMGHDLPAGVWGTVADAVAELAARATPAEP